MAKQHQDIYNLYSFFENPISEAVRAGLELLPYEQRFITLCEFEHGGKVRVHLYYKPNPKDHQLLLDIILYKAMERHIVDLMPIVHQKEKYIRAQFGYKDNTNADLSIDGRLVE